MTDPEALLPLRPVELLLLTMLAAGNRHGYGLRQDILDSTGGRIELEAGTLYRHIRRLEDEGLVAKRPNPFHNGSSMVEISATGADRLNRYLARASQIFAS